MHHFTLSLLGWYAQNRRSLPWRDTKDPYAIWLSEIILQQTRVGQGMDYWRRFIEKWPSVELLAAATEDEVLRMWQGLGYYSRARNLHVAARQIVSLGHFPETYDEIRALKGVGDYTAAAIASFAFGCPKAAVDGNVYRVLSRVFGVDTPINSNEGKRMFASLAQSLLPSRQAADFNQALMDFGSIQCTPKTPRCSECPMQEFCVAHRENRVGELPVKLRKMKVRERRMTYFYVRCQGFTAIHQRSDRDIWQGLWEPYLEEDNLRMEETVRTEDGLAGDTSSKSLHGKTCDNGAMDKEGTLTLVASDVKHVLTHRVILADFYLWQTESRPALPDDYIWIPEQEISTYAIPRLIQRLLKMLP